MKARLRNVNSMRSDADHQYRFSIIVPTYNRPERIAECIAALGELDFPNSDHEVLVVDDGGEVSLNAIIDEASLHMNIRLLSQENAGPASARNHGAKEARGLFLAFIDDDCRSSSGWLTALDNCLSEAPDVLAGGATANRLPENLFSEASETLLQALYAFSNRDPNNGRFFASNNFALSRELFHEIGGFDTGFPLAAAEDRDFCDRLTHQGHRLVSVPEAVVFHSHALGVRSFLRQHFNYGRGALRYQQLRRQRASSGLKDDVGFHLHFFKWLRGPLSRHRRGRALVLTGLVILTQGAYLTGYLFERVRLFR